MEEKYQKLLSFVRKLTRPDLNENHLYKFRKLTEEDGDNAEDIFVNGTNFMEAEIALEARKLLRGLKE